MLSSIGFGERPASSGLVPKESLYAMSPDDLESRSRCDAGDGCCAKAECVANTDACRLYGPYSSFRAREGEPPRAEGEPPG